MPYKLVNTKKFMLVCVLSAQSIQGTCDLTVVVCVNSECGDKSNKNEIFEIKQKRKDEQNRVKA